MRWIIEKVNPENGDEALILAAKAAGHEVSIMKPTGQIPAAEHTHNKCLFHGSIEKAVELQSQPSSTAVWLDKEAFECSNYFPKVGHLLFNSTYIMLPVSEVVRQKWDIYHWLARDAQIFIRPSSGLKPFTGQLLDLQDFDRFWENPVCCRASPSELAVISSPKNIQGEWRFVVDEAGEIISFCTYMYQSNRTYIPGAPKGAIELCRAVLSAGLRLGPLFVLDIAQSPDGQFGLLESNAFSTAGLYACKMEPIVKRAAEL
jgi:ATP-grasp domain, R2K clade family 3